MQKKIELAILGIRISTVIYYLIIVGCIVGWFLLQSDSEEFLPLVLWLLAGFTLAFVIFLEMVIVYLKRRRYWAWVAGIIIGGLFIPSLFLPFGVMILVGLLHEDSRKAFGVGMIQSSGPSSEASSLGSEQANRLL
jgi:Kef-type K+ transport system membrane component KefB